MKYFILFLFIFLPPVLFEYSIAAFLKYFSSLQKYCAKQHFSEKAG